MATNYDARHLIGVQETVSKGKGVFARANIPRGTRVIAESAILEPSRESGGGGTLQNVLIAFNNLPQPQKTAYLDLTGYASNDLQYKTKRAMGKRWGKISRLRRQVFSVWEANHFEACQAVFLLGSRINHSCAPNVNFAFNAESRKGTFHAIRDIRVGEELTIMYIDAGNNVRSWRQAYLERWGFQCNCPVCEDTAQGRARESQRILLVALAQEIEMEKRFDTEESWRRTLQMVQKMASIQQSEGLLDRDLGYSFHDCASYCWKLGYRKMAYLWLDRELEIDRYCLGEDFPHYDSQVKLVNWLRAASDGPSIYDMGISDCLVPNVA